jgi:hypothetical protein
VVAASNELFAMSVVARTFFVSGFVAQGVASSAAATRRFSP